MPDQRCLNRRSREQNSGRRCLLQIQGKLVWIKIGVAYGSDVDQVEGLLLQTAESNQLVTSVPEPRVRFRSFGESALEFELLCWAYQPDIKGKLMHQLNRDIYKSFNAAGIMIPFPQRDVHLINKSDDTSF